MFPILFFVTKLGISTAFGALYVGNAKVFPEEIVASAMGRCQVLARIFGAIQFFITQIEQPTPMIIFTVTSALAALLSLFLRERDGKEEIGK